MARSKQIARKTPHIVDFRALLLNDDMIYPGVLKNIDLSLSEQFETLKQQPPVVDSVSFHPQHHARIRQENTALTLVTNMSRLMSIRPHLHCLQDIDLSYIALGDDGLQHLSGLLDANNVQVKQLRLTKNSFGEVGVRSLLSKSFTKGLVLLELHGSNMPLNYDGAVCVSQFLQQDNNVIKTLSVTISENNNIILEKILSSNSSTLQNLKVDYIQRTLLTNNDVTTLLHRVLCDSSSIESMTASNNMLVNVSIGSDKWSAEDWTDDDDVSDTSSDASINDQPDGDINHVLKLNSKPASTNEKMRWKIQKFILQEGEFDVSPFTDLEVTEMPFALEMLTMDMVILETRAHGQIISKSHKIPSNNLGGLYHVIRNCHIPALYTHPELPPPSDTERIAILEAEVAKLKR